MPRRFQGSVEVQRVAELGELLTQAPNIEVGGDADPLKRHLAGGPLREETPT